MGVMVLVGSCSSLDVVVDVEECLKAKDDFDEDDGGDDDEGEEDFGDLEDEEIEETERQLNGMIQCFDRISIDVEDCSGGSDDESEIHGKLNDLIFEID